MFKCDICGKPLTHDEIKSDDGENIFCADCWGEIEIQSEIMNNEKEEGKE